MALSDVEIRAEIREQRLVFDPSVDADDIERIGSSSVDLSLHERLMILEKGDNPGVIVDPSAPGFGVMDFLRRNGKEKTITEAGFRMEPNQLVIARTLEVVKLQRQLAARVEGKAR